MGGHGTPATDHPGPLVGRDAALDHLSRALRRVSTAGPGIVLVSGPSGIGRTRLLEEFVQREAATGTRLHVSCTPHDRGLDAAAVLAFAWASPPGTPAVPPVEVPSGGPSVLSDVVGVLRHRAEASPPLVLAIDDLHDGHPALLELLPRVLRTQTPLPILVVASYRDDIEVPAAFRALLVGLGRNPTVSHLQLERPLDATSRRPPSAVRDLLVDEIRQLAPPAQRLLELAAACGVSVQHDVLEVVSGLTGPEVETGVDQLLDAALLVRGEGATGYRFRHQLLREVVLDELRPTARRRLHARCAAALTEKPWLVPGGPLVTGSEIARHWREAGDADRAFEATLRAADVAEGRRDHGETYRLQRAAVELYERCSPEVARAYDLADLLRRTGHSADRAGHPSDSVALLERACREVGDDDRPLALLEFARAQFLAGDQLGATRTAAQAIDDLPADAPDAVRSVLTAMTAYRYRDPEVPGTPLEATTEAVRLARLADDRDALVHALCAHALQQAAVADPLGAQASIEEADRLADDVEDPRLALRPALWRLVSLSNAGLVHGVVELGRDAAARADHLGVANSTGRQLRSLSADALVVVGGWDDADRVIEDGLLAGDTGLIGAMLLLARAELAVARGRFTDADDDLTLARERLSHEHPRWSLVAAELCWWRRNVVAAQQHAARAHALAPMFAGAGLDVEAASSYALVRSSLAARHDLGEDATDQLVDDVLGQLAHRSGHPLRQGWQAMAVAETAPTAETRAGGWNAARAIWAEVGAAPAQAYCAWRAGRACVEAGDRAAAADALVEAHTIAARLGATPLLVEVRATAAAAGVPVTRRGTAAPHPVPAASLGLTDREVEVLELVAEGWTNRRIAVHLGVSSRTVGTHVSSILRKLGVATRGEAVAATRRVDPTGTGYVI
jgi:DNA-binding CsgD family transcriptional regulator